MSLRSTNSFLSLNGNLGECDAFEKRHNYYISMFKNVLISNVSAMEHIHLLFNMIFIIKFYIYLHILDKYSKSIHLIS